MAEKNEKKMKIIRYFDPTDLTPWIGFVYTFPERRGRRFAGIHLEEAARLAREEGFPTVFLSANHTGLYEKYGVTCYTQMTDIEGSPSRVYARRTEERKQK